MVTGSQVTRVSQGIPCYHGTRCAVTLTDTTLKTKTQAAKSPTENFVSNCLVKRVIVSFENFSRAGAGRQELETISSLSPGYVWCISHKTTILKESYKTNKRIKTLYEEMDTMFQCVLFSKIVLTCPILKLIKIAAVNPLWHLL